MPTPGKDCAQHCGGFGERRGLDVKLMIAMEMAGQWRLIGNELKEAVKTQINGGEEGGL